MTTAQDDSGVASPTLPSLPPPAWKDAKTSVLERQSSANDAEAGDIQLEERDYKHRQVFKGWPLMWLAYQSTGVIYGDIGTSPLYVFSGIFSAPPSHDDLLGALSLIIWTLTIVVTIKYVCIVLFADDEGEGGTFAVYSLISRYVGSNTIVTDSQSNILKRDPRSKPSFKLQRHASNDMHRPNLFVRSFLEDSIVANVILKTLGVLGVSLVMADGVLTPAQSILGAIQGIEVASPDISKDTVIGVSCAIVVLLFLIQPLGITKLGSVFAPIVIIWLLFNAGFGIYNVATYDAGVFKAFSPYYAGDFFVRNKYHAWESLGGVLLCITGVEALFADLGAFSRSWLCFVFPCLLLAYIGQAAAISANPMLYSNPFFMTVPNGWLYPSLVISILAAIVASQALITSVFQLLSQIMTMSYFPHITMIHSSTKFHGQVYVPLANWLLMLGCVVVSAVYRNTTNLGHAYGFCVILVTFITTCMVTLVALIVWRLHWWLILPMAVIFGGYDLLFVTSAALKVPSGGWFPLALGVVLASIFTLWRYGKEQQWRAEAHDKLSPRSFIIQEAVDKDGDSVRERLQAHWGGGELSRLKGMGIFFDKSGEGVPAVFAQFVQKFETRPEIRVFLHMRALSMPNVPEDEKVTVLSVRDIRDCYRVIIRHGYNERVVNEQLGELVYHEIRRHLIDKMAGLTSRANTTGVSIGNSQEQTIESEPKIDMTALPIAALRFQEHDAHSTTPAESVDSTQIVRQIKLLDDAHQSQVVYMVGKAQLREAARKDPRNTGIKSLAFWNELIGPRMWRSLALYGFMWMRESSRTKVATMRVPVDKLVEVGFVKDI